MADLNLSNVNKAFGKVAVIHDVNLAIADGEFVVFVGPSGCGKSTLLRLVAGLEQPTSGAIKIGDSDVTDADPADRGVAMVFQSYALYPHMTVAENMGFGLKMTGMEKSELQSRVNNAARTLHLTELLDRKPKQLSGGQRQRVAIGRAIVRQPKVFLFDEPLSNLDAELRVQMRLELAKLHKELDATMIYVTHDQVEAMTLADKIVVLRAGRIEQIGSPIELYENPDNVFVAGFMGSPRINFLRARVDGIDGSSIHAHLPDFDNTELNLKLTTHQCNQGDELVVGVRPEQFTTATQTNSTGTVTIQTRIDVMENLGGTAYVYTRNEDNTPLLTIEIDNVRDLNDQELLSASFDSTKCLVFDHKTQARLR